MTQQAVNLMDNQCEPSDEQLQQLMGEVAAEARNKAAATKKSLSEDLIRQTTQAWAQFQKTADVRHQDRLA
jgi:ubiquinone biosynthesis protein UbiJ